MECIIIPHMAQRIQVPIKRLAGQEDLPLPAYQSELAAGMDLYAAVPADKPLTMDPGQIILVPTGIAIAVPPGFEAQVRPRSGLALRHGITLANTPGTIDADYRGEIRLILINLGPDPYEITRGMRIGQILVKPVPVTQWLEVSQLPSTDRGDGGFGHTGS